MNQGHKDKSGRQDVSAPDATVEKSDPTSVDVKRGIRLMVGITLVGVIFLAVLLYIVLKR